MSKLLVNLFLLVLCSCTNPQNNYSSPKGYDLNNPQTQVLPKELDETSGITFYQDNGTEILLAVQDELGRIYWFDKEKNQFESKKFGKKGDYEGLAAHNNMLFILKSDGTLYSLSLKDFWQTENPKVKEYKNLVPKGEYESLAVNPLTNELVMLCKQCPGDRKNKVVTGYVFSITANNLKLKNTFTVATDQLGPIIFKPSAIAFNAQTKQWFIISSVNKMLVETDLNGQVLTYHKLNGKIFEQPEGIVFDKDANLYISSEAGKQPNATLMKFEYKK
ncbi:SdiA-regulated domain-containing protein [Flavobacterium agricola]|uniref:SdiA-regulated domain-containing protein n=1 Tax=Flavobacterium agricola TaxID=2870839 RepID=A0ABY6M3W5_9FLAO|nr:SdiA-regulated domain-containing protein [Flavobacterium agricola]UYW02215.1 SdiA-regulated domain-containing protein [Flavobacterium agricola]